MLGPLCCPPSAFMAPSQYLRQVRWLDATLEETWARSIALLGLQPTLLPWDSILPGQQVVEGCVALIVFLGHSNWISFYLNLILWNSTVLQFFTELKDQRTPELSFTVNFVLLINRAHLKLLKRPVMRCYLRVVAPTVLKQRAKSFSIENFCTRPLKTAPPFFGGY